jgi:hypothetical protein
MSRLFTFTGPRISFQILRLEIKKNVFFHLKNLRIRFPLQLYLLPICVELSKLATPTCPSGFHRIVGCVFWAHISGTQPRVQLGVHPPPFYITNMGGEPRVKHGVWRPEMWALQYLRISAVVCKRSKLRVPCLILPYGSATRLLKQPVPVLYC